MAARELSNRQRTLADQLANARVGYEQTLTNARMVYDKAMLVAFENYECQDKFVVNYAPDMKQ